MSSKLALTQDDAADELLSRDPLALLTGMLLDQQDAVVSVMVFPTLCG